MPMCAGKTRFRTKHAAQVALVGAVIKRNLGNGQRHEQAFYRCPKCDSYHLTSHPRTAKETA